MLKYIIKRILSSILALLGVVTITFFIARVIPSNPEVTWAGQRATPEQLEAAWIELGLDKSLPEQYVIYLNDLIHGDLDDSLNNHQPVATELKRYIPATLELVFLAFILAIVIGIPLGIYSAKKKDRLLDHCAVPHWLGSPYDSLGPAGDPGGGLHHRRPQLRPVRHQDALERCLEKTAWVPLPRTWRFLWATP